MTLIKKYNDRPEVIANKSVIDHNQLANRNQFGAHSIDAIRGLPEKLTKLKNKDIALEEKIDKQSTDLSELTDKVNEVESKASQIDITENAYSTFTFTNYNGSTKTIQSGFLPDDDTWELKDNRLTLKQIHTDSSLEGKGTQEDPLLVNIDNTTITKRADGVLEVTAIKTNGDSISGVTIKEELDNLNKGVERLDNYNASQDDKIYDLQTRTKGMGGYLNAYNFGDLSKLTEEERQNKLTEYALQQIGVTERDRIFNGTKIINDFDKHLWILTNTPDSTPAVFEWEDLGVEQKTSIATDSLLGLIKGSTSDLKGRVDVNGEISINGLQEKLDDKASRTEQNNFTGINNFNAETNFNAEVNVDNNNVNINNGYLSTTDETKDLVTKYSADEVVIENGTAGNANTYNLKLPLKSGTLATTDDIKELQPASKEVLGGVYYWIDDEGIPCLSAVKIGKEAGLYVDGVLSKSWSQLIADGDITVTNSELKVANTGLAGELVCDNVEGLTSLALAFDSCGSLINIDASKLNTTNVTNMSYMFYFCTSLTSLDLSSFDTSNVTNMYWMFYFCTSLTSIDLSSFDTTNVTDMSEMFCYCTSLTSLDLSSFNTTNVTYMNGMFDNCTSLTSLDLSNFTFDKVTDYTNMFRNVPNNCEILVKSQTEKDWITSKFTNLTNVKIKGVEA